MPGKIPIIVAFLTSFDDLSNQHDTSRGVTVMSGPRTSKNALFFIQLYRSMPYYMLKGLPLMGFSGSRAVPVAPSQCPGAEGTYTSFGSAGVGCVACRPEP